MDDFQRIHAKLDAIDGKLDKHLERISKAETNISWLRLGMMTVVAWIGNTFLGGKI